MTPDHTSSTGGGFKSHGQRRALCSIAAAWLLALVLPIAAGAQQSPSPTVTPPPANQSDPNGGNPCDNALGANGQPFIPPNLPIHPPAGLTTPTPAQLAADVAQGNQMAQQQGLYNPNASPLPSASPCPNSSAAPLNGDLLHRIWMAASAFRGTPTNWPGTQCGGSPVAPPDHLGNCSCAAAVQQIIKIVTGQTIGNYSVDSFATIASSGQYGGTIVPASMARAGAIIIWPTHIGICANDTCSQTWSNSSSLSTFAPYTSDITFGGAFSTWTIWEPSHIP